MKHYVMEKAEANEITYQQQGYKDVISTISSAGGGTISLFLGRYTPNKQNALDDISSNSDYDVQLVETSE